jgi:hypothetical protein
LLLGEGGEIMEKIKKDIEKHINKIDQEIVNTDVDSMARSTLYVARSTALQALVGAEGTLRIDSLQKLNETVLKKSLETLDEENIIKGKTEYFGKLTDRQRFELREFVTAQIKEVLNKMLESSSFNKEISEIDSDENFIVEAYEYIEESIEIIAVEKEEF